MIVQKYLNAKQWNVKEAVGMFRYSNKYRAGEFGHDKLMRWKPSSLMLKFVPGGLYGQDLEGNPISYMHAGRADLKGIFRLGTKRDHIKFRMWQLNSLIRYTRILSKKRGKYCGQATLVIDLEGFEFSKLYMPTFKLFNEANKLAQMVYPELLRRIIIINPPLVFSAVFALVKPFLFQRVIDKIVVAPRGKEVSIAALQEYVSLDNLPAMYGGTAPDPDPSGEAVVKKVHEIHDERVASGTERQFVVDAAAKMTDSWTWQETQVDGAIPVCIGGKIPDECFSEIAFDIEGAETCTVPASGRFDVEYEVSAEGSVLEWEFMSEDATVGFELLHTPAAGEQPVSILPMERLDCNVVPEGGTHNCTKAGMYTIRFDNDNWMMGKVVRYKVTLIEQAE